MQIHREKLLNGILVLATSALLLAMLIIVGLPSAVSYLLFSSFTYQGDTHANPQK